MASTDQVSVAGVMEARRLPAKQAFPQEVPCVRGVLPEVLRTIDLLTPWLDQKLPSHLGPRAQKGPCPALHAGVLVSEGVGTGGTSSPQSAP